MIALPNSMNIDTGRLSQVFVSTSASYKFYWFLAILQLIKESNDDFLSIHSILSRMIVNAWYPINFCHLKLGAGDRVGAVIESLINDFHYDVLIRREKLDAELNHASNAAKKALWKLADLVPYRFLSPWTGTVDRVLVCKAMAFDDAYNTPYYFETRNGVKGIRFRQLWLDYFLRNNRILQDFVYFNLATYIQRRNPEVSGLLFKIDYSQYEKRLSLVKQHEFWDEYIQQQGFVHSLYTSRNYESDYRYGLDHFMPWTFQLYRHLYEENDRSARNGRLPGLCRLDRAKQYRSVRLDVTGRRAP